MKNENSLKKKFERWFYQKLMETSSFLVDEDSAAPELLRVLVNSYKNEKSVLAVPSFSESERLVFEINQWAKALGLEFRAVLLPEGVWKNSPTLEDESPRAETLALAVSDDPPDLFVGSVHALLAPVPDPGDFTGAEISIRPGSEFELSRLTSSLVQMGYDDEAETVTVGEFSRRGGILDVFSPGMKLPVRIEFFGNTVDSLREYSPDSGRSVRNIEQCKIIARSGTAPAGPEGWCDFSAYCPGRNLIVYSPDECFDALESFAGPEYLERWELFKTKFRIPFELLTEADAIGGAVDPEPECTGAALALRAVSGENMRAVAELSRKLSAEFVRKSLEEGFRIYLASSKSSDSDHIREWMKENAFPSKKIQTGTFPIPAGLIVPREKMVFLTERELFAACLRGKPRIVHEEDVEPDLVKETAEELESMSDIEVGDITVHLNYGLCKFKGIRTMRNASGALAESLELEFADDMTMFIPVWQAHLLSRYVGSRAGGMKLSKPGSQRWLKSRSDAAGSAKNLAAEMLRMQAIRRASPGIQYPSDDLEQRIFEDSFPYEATEGQKKASEEIKKDMESERPMDRLLCGDVGYGKTEVAMRAAFKCVENGRQVAVLVPTTVLAQQHFISFTERFAEYPIVIETLSRLKTPSEKTEILRRLREGSVDIVIGTHALISKAVGFKDLGLVVIDEEQKFGVEHKEKLKAVRATVDVLTMTATPIPRTLHMSMAGLRDLSAITTAPVKRMPVHTVVIQEDPSLISAALSRELGRNGQVFYLHNRVNTIEKCAEKVRLLAPTARVAVAHGQMKGTQLEDIMTDFIDGKIDILVCTTIIESGIDIPNANTIIIERADTFGLAELHQLRGRVGRSTRQAFACLLLPPDGVMTSDAKRRMAAIRRYTHLGAGFKLAIRDLEIRGAGNIIGSEQSGYVDAIGFHLYCSLLKDASNSLRGVTTPKIMDCELNFDFLEFALSGDPKKASACIPASYIEEDRLRLDVYRRLATITDISALPDIQKELRDRFGVIPEPAENFLKTVNIRILASSSGFKSCLCRDGKIYLERDGTMYRENGCIPKIPTVLPPGEKLNILLALIRKISRETPS